VADSTSIGGLTSLRIGLVALPVLVEGDVEVRRLLPGVVLSETGCTPVHHAGVLDPPRTRADVAMGHRASDDPGPQTSRLHTRFKRSFGGQVKEYAGMWDLHIHAVKYSLYRAAKTFGKTYIDRSLKPPLMRPSLVLVRKAGDRMWFRRHWYWPSGYIVVGIIVALLTNNIHLSSLSGILLSILAVLLWPFILGAALCRLLGFHIPGIDIT
jgi:FemAB family